MLKLQFTDGSQKGVWLIEPKQRIGKDRKNDFVISEEGIGDFHAEVHIDGDSLRLEPLGGCACEVNGNAIAGVTPIKLGDTLRLGNVEMSVVDPGAAVAKAKKQAAKPVAPAAGKSPWALVGAQGKRFAVQGTMTLGRSPDCDIAISYDRLSRKHAELKESNGVLHVRDLGSANGTFLNDKPVKESEVRVQAGDKLRFDMLTFTVEGPQDDMNKTVVRPAIDPAALQKAAADARQAKAKKPARPRPAASRPVAQRPAASRPATGTPATTDTENGSGLILAVVIGVVVVAVLGAAAWFLLQ